MQTYVRVDGTGYISEVVWSADEELAGYIKIDGLNNYEQGQYGAIKVEEGASLHFDVDKYAADKKAAEEREAEQASIPTPQQEIEKLKTENAELKKYVELISDSVVDLAMRTLKEV